MDSKKCIKAPRKLKAMASSSNCQLLSFILFTNLILFLFISPSSHAISSGDVGVVISAASNAAAPKKVDLALYYETLCPYCAEFIVNKLVDVFNKGLDSYVNLRLVPWGNAELGKNGTITCQHGPTECMVNTIDACIIKIWPNVNQHFKYIRCIEALLLKDNHEQDLRTCFGKKMDWQAIKNCYSSGLGTQLFKQYGSETDKLNPPRQYVPWVVVNNVPLKDDYENYLHHVCKLFNGQVVPEGCKSVTLKIESSNEKPNPGHGVCYASDGKGNKGKQKELFVRRMQIKP